MMVLIHVVFYGVGAIYTLMDITNKPQFLRKYKIQPGTNEPVDNLKLKNLVRYNFLKVLKCPRKWRYFHLSLIDQLYDFVSTKC